MEQGKRRTPAEPAARAGSALLKLAADKALLIALMYLLLGLLWILGSDSALNALFTDPGLVARMQTWKGWFYVALTAVLLYVVLYRVLRSEAAQLLRQSRQREDLSLLNQFRESIIDNANIWINVLDAQARVTVWNKAAEQISGYRRDEVIGGDGIWALLYPDEDYRNDIARRVKSILEDGLEVEGFETRMRCRDGGHKIISWNQRRFFSESGEIGSIAIGQDVTERKRLQQELERMAVHDPLTGLCNRREFEALASAHFADCVAQGRPFSMLWIDIDGFKSVNDRFGHQVGDDVLRGVAGVLRDAVDEHGIAARYGGDELVVALPGCTASEARATGEAVRRRVQGAGLLEACAEEGGVVTVSVGAAEGDGHVADLAALASAADKAMYRAKTSGRNRVCGLDD